MLDNGNWRGRVGRDGRAADARCDHLSASPSSQNTAASSVLPRNNRRTLAGVTRPVFIAGVAYLHWLVIEREIETESSHAAGE